MSTSPHLADCAATSEACRLSLNAFWENDSFHNYADHALGAAFREGMKQLRQRGESQTCAIMCAETVWWRCHRRIITDYLLAAGESVFHVLGPGHVDAAVMTEAAQPRPDGSLVYPAGQGDLFDHAP